MRAAKSTVRLKLFVESVGEIHSLEMGACCFTISGWLILHFMIELICCKACKEELS